MVMATKARVGFDVCLRAHVVASARRCWLAKIISTTSTMLSKIIDAAAPNGQFPALPLNCSSINEPIMKFFAPPRQVRRKESPKAGHKHKDTACNHAGFDSGQTMRRRVVHLVA